MVDDHKDNRKRPYATEAIGGKGEITDTEGIPFFFFFDFPMASMALSITLPEGIYGALVKV